MDDKRLAQDDDLPEDLVDAIADALGPDSVVAVVKLWNKLPEGLPVVSRPQWRHDH